MEEQKLHLTEIIETLSQDDNTQNSVIDESSTKKLCELIETVPDEIIFLLETAIKERKKKNKSVSYADMMYEAQVAGVEKYNKKENNKKSKSEGKISVGLKPKIKEENINLDLKKIEKILNDHEISKESFNTAVCCLLSAISENELNYLWDQVQRDMYLITIEKLLEPYLNGKVRLEYVDENSKKSKFKENTTPQIEFDGYNHLLRIKEGDCFILKDNEVLYNKFYKMLFNTDVDDEDNSDKRALFDQLVDKFAVPKEIWPFAFMAVYIQYLSADRDKVESGYLQRKIEEKISREKIIDDCLDNSYEAKFISTLERIVPKKKYKFQFLKEETRIKLHLGYVQFLAENKNDVDYLLNLYLYNHYFPIVDVMCAIAHIPIPIYKSDFEKNYQYLCEYTNIKGMLTKQRLLHIISSNSSLIINKTIISAKKDIFMQHSLLNRYFNQLSKDLLENEITNLKTADDVNTVYQYYKKAIEIIKLPMQSLVDENYDIYYKMYDTSTKKIENTMNGTFDLLEAVYHSIRISRGSIAEEKKTK